MEPVAKRADLVYFDRTTPPAHFGLPAHPTVEWQLTYYSKFTEARGEPLFIQLWNAAQSLIKEWECSLLLDPLVDLKSITDPAVTTVIMWAGNQVSSYVTGLDALPKV
jgi:hypothetical protein